MPQPWNIGLPLPPLNPATLPGAGRPDWAQCDEAFIARALARTQQRQGGGWVVVDATTTLTETPRRYDMAGEEWVAWRVNGEVLLAPNTCPHLGAELCDSKVERGNLICPWHGLALGARGHGDWQTVPTFDDGILVWARLLHDETPTDAPLISPRPSTHLHGVVALEGNCEPQDIVANRLDPWHGAHFHPHSFANLVLAEVDENVLKVRVAYKVVPGIEVEVDCTFHAPTKRSIVMTIVDGDGVGSVVETHATPISAGRSRLVEATIATSDRPGFAWALPLQKLIRPLIEARTKRLWVEDVAYAERRYTLRQRALLTQASP